MAWDPFGDRSRKGILRNKFRIQDPQALALLEYHDIQQNMGKALVLLQKERRICLASWKRTHAVLLSGIYPWAGKVRELDVERGGVRFNTANRVPVDADAVFREVEPEGFLRANVGYVYGELGSVR